MMSTPRWLTNVWKRYLTSLERHPWFWFGFRFFVAVLFLRLAYGYVHIVFSQDQARDAFLMKQFAQEGKFFIPYGPKASVGNFYLPPLYYQAHYWLSSIFHHPPLIMQWVITIAESFTPVVLFFWLRYVVKSKTAFWVALTYSLFLFPTSFGTFAWNPNMIPFFSTLAAYAWFSIIWKKQAWPIFIGVLATTVAIHLHYQAVVLVPFGLIVFLYDVSRKPSRFWYWVAAGLLGLSTFLPYLLTEWQTGWPNTLQIEEYFTQEHSRYFDRVSKIDFVVTFIPAFVEKVIWNVEFPLFIFGRLFWGVTGVIFGLLAFTRPRWRWIALYFLCIVVMLRVYKGDKLEYYLSTLYVLPAFLIASTWRVGQKFYQILLIALAGWAGFSLLSNPSPDSIPDLNQAVAFIQQQTDPSQPFGLHFHNDDLVNVFSYKMLGNQDFPLAAGSRQLLEICEVGDPCAWNGVRECRYSRGYTYSILLKQNGYEPKTSQVIGSRYVLLVGDLKNPRTSTGYQLYPDDDSFGSDVLLPGIYKN